MAIKHSFINRMLNQLPAKKLTCNPCKYSFSMKLGLIRHSKKNYGGPYCVKCGKKIQGK